jgi:hypothetical protein
MKARPRYYRLEPDHSVTPIDDGGPVDPQVLIAWALMYAGDARRVAFDQVGPGIEVSTVFLGIDHRFGGDGPPIVFETMVFDDYGGNEMVRYCTWDAAVAGHAETVAKLKERIGVGHDV